MHVEEARTLAVAAEELGPARGLAPYAGQPADLRMPVRLKETEASE